MRTKRGFVRRHRVKRLLKAAKGFHAGRSKLYAPAKETVRRALWYGRTGRRLRKRDFRRLWITRITAAAHLRGVSYNRLMSGLRKAQVELNRKVLANLALTDEPAFDSLVKVAQGSA